jgi:hypothetical protein
MSGPPRRLTTLVLVCVALILVALAAYKPASRRLTRDSGEHLTRAETPDRIRLDLPAGASDVRFYLHTRPEEVVTVDFALDEKDFLEWAAGQSWKLERIGAAVTLWPRLGFGDRQTEVKITDGYTYRNHRGRSAPNTVMVHYDRAGRRAYYAFWSAPQGGEE